MANIIHTKRDGALVAGDVEGAGHRRASIGFSWEVQRDGSLFLAIFEQVEGLPPDAEGALRTLASIDLYETGCEQLIVACEASLKATRDLRPNSRSGRDQVTVQET